MVLTLTVVCELWIVGDYAGLSEVCWEETAEVPDEVTWEHQLLWIRLGQTGYACTNKETYFLLTFMKMKDNRLQIVFKSRVRQYVDDGEKGMENKQQSPVTDMLNTSAKFGILSIVLEMVFGHRAIMGKKEWLKMVWKKAWGIDDNSRHSTKALFDRTDMLVKTIGKSQCSTWWRIADKWPAHQRMCETMAHLVCHRSCLKDEDPRLKGTGFSKVVC